MRRPAPSAAHDRRHALSELGRGIAGLRIVGRSEQHHSYAMTDEHGAFELSEPVPDAPPLQLEIAPGATEAYRSEHALPWGTSGFAIALRAPLDFELHVIDAATRRPIESYSAMLTRAGDLDSSRNQRRAGPHAEGRVRFEGLLRGLWIVKITPETPEHVAPAAFEITIADDVARERIVALEPRPRIPVVVRDAEGLPLADAELRLLRIPPGLTPSAWSPVDDPLRADDRSLHTIDVQRTDASGQAALRGFAADRRLVLRASHPRCAPAVLPAAFETRDAISIELMAGARVRFRFATPSRSVAPPRAPLFHVREGELDELPSPRQDGDALVADHLPAGDYQLSFVWNGRRECRASERFALRTGGAHEQVVALPEEQR